MSATGMLARPPSLFDREESPRLAAGRRDDRLTLEKLVLDVWEGLSSQRPFAVCPVCHGEMVARYGAGSSPVGGRCVDCGSELG